MPPSDRCRRDLSPRALCRAARSLYADAARPAAWAIWYRPYICPFDRLIEQVPPGARVLDVGCGSGLLLGLLARAGRIGEGMGCDSSAGAIELAQRMARRVRQAGPGPVLRFERCDVTVDLPAGQFDVVALIDLLHHLPADARPAVLRAAADRVRPGGRLICKEMSDRPRWQAWANRLHDRILAGQWVQHVQAGQVRRWAREAGLVLVESQVIRRLWYGHELSVFSRPLG